MKLEALFEMYTAYVLDKKSRRELAKKFPPKHDEFIGHHITVNFGVPKGTPKPSQPKKVEVVGYANNDDGLEALVVAVNGKTDRPGGSKYHITWSLNRSEGFKPVHSNKLISKGYEKIDPIPITITPQVLK